MSCLRLSLWCCLATLSLVCVRAQDDASEPGRGVVRISLTNGDVSTRRGDSGDVIAAAVNAPLMAQDSIATGPGAVAELQFDAAHMLRLGSSADVRLGELDYRRYTAQIAHGTVMLRVLQDQAADFELSTPSVSLRPLRSGAYRVTVRDDGSTEISVRAGEADVFTSRGSQRLTPGRTMLLRGDPNDPEFQLLGALPYDGWDRWNESRDQEITHSQSRQFVSQDIYGAEDLDNSGRWLQDPEYGNVWTPNIVANDWAPYRNGRWTWQDYYGWSWVSYEPWGWAPYHYGRWFYRPAVGWCWFPGDRGARQYWSPGLVAFFGFGGDGGYGLGFGNVGWLPLAPHERYDRWYGGGFNRGGYGGFNVVHNANIFNTYRNGRYAQSISMVRADSFGRGQIGQRWDGRTPLQSASIFRGGIPVVPSRDSLRFNNTQTRVAPRSFAAGQGTRAPFFSRRSPSSTERVPFEQQQRGVQQLQQRAFGRQSPYGQTAPADGRQFGGRPDSGWRQMGSSQPPSSANTGRPVSPNAPSDGSQTWRRFGSPVDSGSRGLVGAGQHFQGQAPEPQYNRQTPQATGREGWQRFGEATGARSLGVPADRIRPPQNYGNPQPSAPRYYGGAGAPNLRQQVPAAQVPAYPAQRTNPQYRSYQGNTYVGNPEVRQPRQMAPSYAPQHPVQQYQSRQAPQFPNRAVPSAPQYQPRAPMQSFQLQQRQDTPPFQMQQSRPQHQSAPAPGFQPRQMPSGPPPSNRGGGGGQSAPQGGGNRGGGGGRGRGH